MFFSLLFFVFDDRLEKRNKRFFFFSDHLQNGGTVFLIKRIFLFFSQFDVVLADTVADE